jgi:hypothetical protein
MSKFRRWMVAALLAAQGTAQAQEDNSDLTAQIAALIGVHNAALPLSFFPDPFVGMPAGAVTLSTNIGLKYVPPVLQIPNGWAANPNTPDQCHFRTRLPQSVSNYSNLLGLVNTRNAASNWGAFSQSGSVSVAHANTDVVLTLQGEGIQSGRTSAQDVLIPAGGWNYTWSARSQISDLLDVVLPAAFLGFNAARYASPWANQGASAASQAARNSSALDDLFDVGLELGLIGAGQAGIFPTRDTVNHVRSQQIVVFDVHDPTITTNRNVFDFEATDFGGVLLSRVASQLSASITAFDECDRRVVVSNDAPVLLPIGDTVLTSTVRDPGPVNASGGFNTASLTQLIRVRDTQAPIMVPPPSRVIEVPAVATGLSAAGVSLGSPRVVDLADPQPLVTSNSPTFFPKDSRTPITWTATDASGNASTAAQLITVKTQGENTAPVVSDIAVSTLTSQPVDIVLRGTDSDLIGGRFDPLNFRITQRPANGEFEAPLFPFFIEDYRTNPAGPYGEGFRLSNNRNRWMLDNVCNNFNLPPDQRPRVDWVYQPRFVHVTDDGTSFLLDFNWECRTGSNVGVDDRISKWDSEGNYLGQIDYNGTTNTFVMDQDGLIYELAIGGSGGQSRNLTLRQFRTQFETQTQSELRGDIWVFNDNSTSNPAFGPIPDPIATDQLSYARVDSRRGLVYLTDRRRVFVFDVRADFADGLNRTDSRMQDKYLGALNNAEAFLNSNTNSTWTGFAMDVDAAGALYVADTGGHRVHKFSPSYFDESGDFVMGEYVGWMGRCDTSTNNACDESTGTSRGYACTDQTCSVSVDPAGFAPGQFTSPVFLALDPNGVLYVADAGEPNAGGRVQRFGADGTFGGEARSTGTGINQGERPGFVLGNLGTVKAVSVNSTNFFVVDQAESFVHVFETTPLKDITDDSATVTYVSNFAFHSAQDEFRYVASDGLADSNTGRVFVNVARNFRPPVAFPQTLSMDEDTVLDITLEAEDPDGILGVDFNGLDTLTYRIVRGPANGSLSGTGVNRTYTPTADFFGEDSFVFVANDGRDDSPEQTVNITVNPINDPPRLLSVRIPDRVSIGFPMTVVAEYVEDGAGDSTATVDWGEFDMGVPVTSSEGSVVFFNGTPELAGILIVDPPRGVGVGRAIASHVYSGFLGSPGSRVLRFCVFDQLNQPDCQNTTVNVELLANLSLEADVRELDLSPNASSAIVMVVTNHAMRDVPVAAGMNPGLVAEGVTVAGSFSMPGVAITAVSDPACQLNSSGGFTCALGSMAPGTSRSISIFVRTRTDLVYDVAPQLRLRAATATPALDPFSEQTVAVFGAADTTDSDGDGMSDVFERTYGFNPANPADAAADADGDGLSNLEEFIQRTNPLLADTDGDGLPDGFEVANGLNPLDGSDCPSWICGSGTSGWRAALLREALP